MMNGKIKVLVLGVGGNVSIGILKAINTKNFFISKYNFNPYKIKIGSKRASVLKKYLKNDWGTSYLDGDCLL